MEIQNNSKRIRVIMTAAHFDILRINLIKTASLKSGCLTNGTPITLFDQLYYSSRKERSSLVSPAWPAGFASRYASPGLVELLISSSFIS
jgi:hypothetical protein